MSISERLREERERLGLSQAAMAEVANVSVRSQSGWETGRNTPSTEAYQQWAKIGVDINYIITGIPVGALPATLPADEEMLLNAYRAAPVSVRNSALAVLLSGGQAPEGVDTSKERKGRAAPKKVKQWIDNNEGGQVYGDVGTVNITSKKRDE
ncbi:helix-turn-helix domain-containing protein [Oligella urethralis]|uniref:helix-turn-helix domain-containing protein n=1 Tax=Oligella urethralis TaxID=90245 RepID=UPI000E033ED4|nr:helix-turn-helix transcriptional regulator [Oligella urethralis]SUA58046.1 transcriptional repressor DicA [Oligella urethralis]